MDVNDFLNNVVSLTDRPAQWAILPPDYAPFKSFQSADGTKWYVPCINLKDKNGKPEGTISVVEISAE